MALAAAVPPPFSAGALLRGWSFEPLVVVPIIVVGVLYLAGLPWIRRRPGPAFPPRRAWAFVASLVVLVAVVDGPFATYSDVDLAVRMGQNMLLLSVVPALAVLGAPATLALGASTPRGRSRYLEPVLHSRIAHALTRPWVVGSLYAVDLLATHLTGFYNLALENQYIHDFQELGYLVVGALLWGVVFGVDSVGPRPGYLQRIMVVVLLMPVMVVIALVFILVHRPLYPYLTALPPPWGGSAHALSNQVLAGAVMWIPSGFFSLAAVLYISVGWFREGETRQLLLEALEDARARSGT